MQHCQRSLLYLSMSVSGTCGGRQRDLIVWGPNIFASCYFNYGYSNAKCRNANSLTSLLFKQQSNKNVKSTKLSNFTPPVLSSNKKRQQMCVSKQTLLMVHWKLETNQL